MSFFKKIFSSSKAEPVLNEQEKQSLDKGLEKSNQSIFEKCLELIHVFKYLRKKKLLVFINICSYLTEKEMATLLEEISLVNISVLFIEPNEVYQFQQYVMDEDYCLFEIKP